MCDAAYGVPQSRRRAAASQGREAGAAVGRAPTANDVPRRNQQRRAVLLEVLAGAGLRIGEALELRWRDTDLGTGTLYVRASKTGAGVREVHLTPALRETLTLWARPCSERHRRMRSGDSRTSVATRVEVEVPDRRNPGIGQFHVRRVDCRREYVAPEVGRIVLPTGRRLHDVVGRADVARVGPPTRPRGPAFHADAYDADLDWAAMGSNVDLELVEAEAEAV
jgi:integrase